MTAGRGEGERSALPHGAAHQGGASEDPRLDPPPGLLVRALARLAAWLLPLGAAPADPAALRRVLVVRTDDRMGNALLTLPLVRALAQALPRAQVDLLLPAARAPVVRGLDGVNLIEFDKRDSFRHPVKFIRFLRTLRARGYDAAIDAAHWHAFSLTSALLTRWAARRLAVGSARGPLALYSRAVPLPPAGAREVEAKLLLAEGLGLARLQTLALETALGTSSASQASARAARAQLGLAGPFAALNPGARKADHRWDPKQFAALARGLLEQHGLPSLVLWGPGEEELARALCAASGGAARPAPPTDLDALAAHLRAAALAVANDTGPMHLAAACGAPVLAIFLAPDGARWGHPGPRFAGLDVRALPEEERAPAGQVRRALRLAAQLLALTGSPGGASVPRPLR